MNADGWTTVKRTPRKAKKNPNTNGVARTSSDFSYDTVVFKKPQNKKKNGPRNATRKSGTSGYASSIEKKAHDGSFNCKKYDRTFISKVVAKRSQLGLKQSELNQRLALPANTIKSLESNKLIYNPTIKQRIENRLNKL